MINLADVINASLSQLSGFFLKENSTFSSPCVLEYAKAARTFLQGERLEVSPEFIAACKTSEELFLLSIAELRGQISANKIELECIDNIANTSSEYPMLEGEALFVCAIAAYYVCPLEKAFEYNDRAYQALNRQNLKNKAGRALLNKVSILGQIKPHANLISDFIYLAKYAKENNDKVVEGASYVNIARQYQKSKKLKLALSYAELAIACIEDDAGSINYFFAHLIRAFIFYDLGMIAKCQEDVDRVLISPHLELHEGAKALSNIIQGREIYKINQNVFSPTLKDILNVYKSQVLPKIGEHEKLLIEKLYKEQRNRYELIGEIYPEQIPMTSLENRFKNLLTRMRKKYPGLVQNVNGQYQIADQKLAKKILHLS